MQSKSLAGERHQIDTGLDSILALRKLEASLLSANVSLSWDVI